MPWHSSKVLNHTYRRICNLGNVQCDLYLKVPRECPRVKPLLWVEKIAKYRWFCAFWAAKNWKKFQSGVRYKCGSYSSVKLKNRQITEYNGDIALMIVQNAEIMGVREGKTSMNWSFYAPKITFMDATVARGFMPDGTVVTFTQRYLGWAMIT